MALPSGESLVYHGARGGGHTSEKANPHTEVAYDPISPCIQLISFRRFGIEKARSDRGGTYRTSRRDGTKA